MTMKQLNPDATRQVLLQNIANVLAHDAADALEPLAGQPISEGMRQALESDVLAALVRHVPGLVNPTI